MINDRNFYDCTPDQILACKGQNNPIWEGDVPAIENRECRQSRNGEGDNSVGYTRRFINTTPGGPAVAMAEHWVRFRDGRPQKNDVTIYSVPA